MTVIEPGKKRLLLESIATSRDIDVVGKKKKKKKSFLSNNYSKSLNVLRCIGALNALCEQNRKKGEKEERLRPCS